MDRGGVIWGRGRNSMGKAKTYTFFLESYSGTLKKGYKQRQLERALERVLTKFCGTEWEYNRPDDGLWGE